MKKEYKTLSQVLDENCRKKREGLGRWYAHESSPDEKAFRPLRFLPVEREYEGECPEGENIRVKASARNYLRWRGKSS